MTSKRQGRPKARLRVALAASSALLVCFPAFAQDHIPRNNFGSAGLIDMPSARMAPDGELSAGAFFTKNTQRYNLGFQALPWLEASFRYTGINDFHPAYPIYYDRSFSVKARLWDETNWLPALAVGINDIVGTGAYGGEFVVASKRIGPVDLSVGLGWGRMGSIAHFRNPLSLLSDSFDTRPGQFLVGGVTPGAANFGNLFHGRDVGLFGGVAWTTPLPGLTLMAEYSSDAYVLENQLGALKTRNQFNFGASYALNSSMQLNLSWMNGNNIAGNLTFLLDPVRDSYPQKFGPQMLPPQSRPQQDQMAGIAALRGVPNTPRARVDTLTTAAVLDALWRDDTVNNVSINGQTAQIALARGDVQTACRNAAQLLARQPSGITQVQVSLGGQNTSCAVTPLHNFSQPANFVTASARSAAAEPMVINAAPVPRPTLASAEAKIRAGIAAQLIQLVALRLGGGEATVYYTNTRYFHEIEALERLTRVLMAEAPAEIERFRFIATQGGAPQREYTVLRSVAERNLEQIFDLDFTRSVQSAPAPSINPVLAAAVSKTYPRFTWSLFPQLRQSLFDPSNALGIQVLAAAQGTLEILPGLSLTGQAEASMFDNYPVNRLSDSVLPHVRTDFVQYFVKGRNGIPNLELNYRFRLSPTMFAITRAGYLEGMFAGVGGEVLYRPEGARWALGWDLYGLRQRNFDRLFGFQNYEVVTGHMSFYYQSPWYGLNAAFRIGRYLAGDYGATFELTRRFDSGVEIGAFFTKTNVTSAQFGEGSFDKGIMIRIPISWAAPLQSQNQLAMDLRPVQRDGGQRLNGDAILYEETRRLYAGQLAMTGPW